MSISLPVGVEGPSHWSYMASKLAHCIDQAINQKEIEKDLVPKGVFIDATEFFNLVLRAIKYSVPADPSASLNAYAIATDAIRVGLGDQGDSKVIQNSLRHYAAFSRSLIK